MGNCSHHKQGDYRVTSEFQNAHSGDDKEERLERDYSGFKTNHHCSDPCIIMVGNSRDTLGTVFFSLFFFPFQVGSTPQHRAQHGARTHTLESKT